MIVFIVFFITGYTAAAEITSDDVEDLFTRAKEMQEKITLPDNPNKKAAENMARETFEKYQSEEFQARLKAEMERVQKQLTGDAGQMYYADVKNDTEKILSNEQIYIFISSSMPVSTIRNYVQDVAYLGDPNIKFVMRGFVDGIKKFGPTRKFIWSVLKKDPSCKGRCEVYKATLQVNPVLYRRFNIESVPAILYVKGTLPKEACKLNEKEVSYPNWVIYGDASLETATEIFADKLNSESLRRLNKKLRNIDS